MLGHQKVLYAQDYAVPEPVICGYSLEDSHIRVLSSSVANAKEAKALATFEVTFTDFPEQAKNAFNLAVSYWANTLVSTVPIRVNAVWGNVSGTTLASSGATKIFRNFQNVPYFDVWYPVALAESISGKNLNGNEYDINVSVNPNMDWSYDLNGNAFSGKFDFTTVMLHELAHGLGFASSMKLINNNTQGEWGYKNMPYVYDLYVQNGQAENLIDKAIFTNASEGLMAQFQSDNLYFDISIEEYIGGKPRLYAPARYQSGGSISHTHEEMYAGGTSAALMTPTIFSAEVIHEPGDLNKAILSQMGWGIRNFSSAILLSATPVEQSLKVYPNPASEIIKVYIPASMAHTSAEISIIDYQGRVVKSLNYLPSQEAVGINISDLNSGLYFLTYKTDFSKHTRKFIKQ